MTAIENRVSCKICSRQFKPADVIAGSSVRDSIAVIIRKTHPDWSAQDFICLDDLNGFRRTYVRDALELEREDLSSLEAAVVKAGRDHEFVSDSINIELEKRLSPGERVADAVAAFGGSWKFVIGYSGMIVVWILINSLLLLRQPFDPYPYILLNLVLSCLSSLQGPVILMSQNRQNARDRLRSEYDYQVNTKAELEIRQLNTKMDLLLKRQWQRLMEIQEIQLELLQQYHCEKPGSCVSRKD